MGLQNVTVGGKTEVGCSCTRKFHFELEFKCEQNGTNAIGVKASGSQDTARHD